ncbi:MAG TPA: response regulator transcription factor [Actinomycetota bacterium]|nr:response regulator transcription factor [Actinomycetota bacterium]
MSERVRILVVHPGAFLREALVDALERMDGLEVAGQTASLDDACAKAERTRPDVALVDADLLEDQTPELLGHLKRDCGCGHVLLVADRVSQVQAERALSAGADGFTLKGISLAELADSIRRVAAGEVLLHPAVASVLVQSLSAFARGERHAGPVLTPRQQEIIRLLAMGLPNKQIARRLGIGVETVKTHISKVLAKLGVGSRTEAVIVAMREGVLAAPGAPGQFASITQRPYVDPQVRQAN